MPYLYLYLGLFLSLFCLIGYFVVSCYQRSRVMRDQDDYYRGYNEMYARCITHGSQSLEVQQWLQHAESHDDRSSFDCGIVDGYSAYSKYNDRMIHENT